MDDDSLVLLQTNRLTSRTAPPALELHVQLVGASFCASLSQAILEPLNSLSYSAPPSLSAFLLAEAGAMTATAQAAATEALLRPLQLDLSAHYGSWAVRRGGSKPFGPCYRPTSVSGKHIGRGWSLWKPTKMRRLWCPRCGVCVRQALSTYKLPCVASTTAADAAPSGRHPCSGRVSRVCIRCFQRSLRTIPTSSNDVNGSALTCSVKKCLVSLAGQDAGIKRRRRKRTRHNGKVASPGSSSVASPVGNANFASLEMTPHIVKKIIPKGPLGRSARRPAPSDTTVGGFFSAEPTESTTLADSVCGLSTSSKKGSECAVNSRDIVPTAPLRPVTSSAGAKKDQKNVVTQAVPLAAQPVRKSGAKLAAKKAPLAPPKGKGSVLDAMNSLGF